MTAHDDDTIGRAAGRPLGADLSTHVEAIVRAAEREARAAERAIAASRRDAEEEARRYLAAARLHVDAEAAARAARLETYGAAARRLSQELADAAAALTRELRAAEEADVALPRPPWPAEGPPPPAPTWARVEHEPRPAERVEPVESPPAPAGGAPHEAETAARTVAPSAARLVAIEMAVGGSSRADVEHHLRDELGVAVADSLLDDVFGPASHAGSRLAWGEP